ncbi:MAG TPA: NAD(P)-dependent oxidoreductase [Acidimicrobiales bacterium]|nr:NAD(P)-dependent oxidoreductase [Acidimicrobiales bacterium]
MVPIAVAPAPTWDWVRRAIEDAGGEIVELPNAAALVWLRPDDPAGLKDALSAAPALRWVQLPWAGIEPYAAGGLLDGDRVWTCGKGVYAEPVAEHALALALAGLRHLPERVRASSWGAESGRSLFDGAVTILGGGGIAQTLTSLLVPMRTRVTVVRRDPTRPVSGAAAVVGPEELDDAVATADVVVVALALTDATRGIVGAAQLRRMQPHAWLVNVGRGPHVVTDDLVTALREGWIAGAALDVTDPEPLPDGHPLWSLPNCLITPHTANTFEMAVPLLAARISENVARFAAGEPLVGVVDVAAGY